MFYKKKHNSHFSIMPLVTTSLAKLPIGTEENELLTGERWYDHTINTIHIVAVIKISNRVYVSCKCVVLFRLNLNIQKMKFPGLLCWIAILICVCITNSIDEVPSYQNIIYINVINSIDRSICLYLVHQRLMVQTQYNKMIRQSNNSVLMPDLYMSWKHVKMKVE